MPQYTFIETAPFGSGSVANNALGTAAATLVAAAATPRQIDDIIVTSTEVVARVVDLIWQIGGTNRVIGSVSIPAGSGFGGVAPVNMLVALAAELPNGIRMQANDTLLYQMETVITSPLVLNLTVSGGLV